MNPGNLHDSRTFKNLCDKVKKLRTETLVADVGYKTPAIAKLLMDNGIQPLFLYRRPMTKKDFSKNMSMFMMSTLKRWNNFQIETIFLNIVNLMLE